MEDCPPLAPGLPSCAPAATSSALVPMSGLYKPVQVQLNGPSSRRTPAPAGGTGRPSPERVSPQPWSVSVPWVPGASADGSPALALELLIMCQGHPGSGVGVCVAVCLAWNLVLSWCVQTVQLDFHAVGCAPAVSGRCCADRLLHRQDSVPGVCLLAGVTLCMSVPLGLSLSHQ